MSCLFVARSLTLLVDKTCIFLIKTLIRCKGAKSVNFLTSFFCVILGKNYYQRKTLKSRREQTQNVRLLTAKGFNTNWAEMRIKLCLLLWLGFFKTMKLLLSVRRDLSVRCREIILVLNRAQSTDFRR